MFSSTRTLRVFVLFTLLASVVQAHDARLASRDHAGIQRMMKKRAPQGLGGLGPIQANAGDDDVFDTSSTSSGSSTSSATGTSVSSTGTASLTATSSSVTSSSNSTSTSTSASSSSTESSSSAPTQAPTDTLKLQPVPGPSTVTGAAVTRTQSVQPSQSISADRQGNVANNDNKSTTITTVIIAVAASIGGIAILWTIFRKWKLSSSKSFDQRLDPNWRPPSPIDDSPIPTHRTRRVSGSSFHSGSAHGPNNGTSFDHDFTAGATHSTPVGGYADLARGSSPNPQMQEHRMNRGPSAPVPLHYGGNQGPFEAYDYNGNGVRY